MEKKSKTKTKKSKPRVRIKKKFVAVLFLILIGLLIGIVYGIRALIINLQYMRYTEKMYDYGLATLYNNGKATATQKVSNEEMLKILLAAVNGKTDIDSIYYSEAELEQDKWLQYATDLKFTNNINKDNLKERASNTEMVLIASRALQSVSKVDVQPAELKLSASKLAQFTYDEQQDIAKAVSMEIVKNKNSAVSGNYILKGELNKLAVTIIEKYATIYYNSVQLNEQGVTERTDVNIVTDKNKMPNNYKEYPYIIDSIPTEVYEYDFDIMTERTAQTPKEAYKYMGSLYGQIDELLVNYFDTILNVDYANITTKSFLQSIENSVVYKLSEQDVEEYVEYVKEHKIKLMGKAEPLLPIIYNNGEQYIVRTKLTFEVLNSNTEYNLLFGDENQSVKYNGKTITMYVEVPMGMTLNSWSLRVYVATLANHLLANSTNVVVEE